MCNIISIDLVSTPRTITIDNEESTVDQLKAKLNKSKLELHLLRIVRMVTKTQKPRTMYWEQNEHHIS